MRYGKVRLHPIFHIGILTAVMATSLIRFAYLRPCAASPQKHIHPPAVTHPPKISADRLNSAITEGDIRIMRAALDQGKHLDFSSLLIYGAGFGHPSIVQFALEHGSAANVRAQNGETPLWQAADADLGDDTELGWETVQANYAKIIRLLLDHGADPNIPDSNGVTPLDIACYRNRISAVKALLNSHADLNYRDDFGKTPIEWASYYSYPEIVKMLLAHGAHVDAKRGLPEKKQLELDRSLDNAITEHNITEVKHLLSRGADPNCSLPFVEDLDHMEMAQLITPLFLSANSPLITRLLLAKGADPNKCDDSKYTPLMAAVGSNYVQVTPFPVVPEVAQILIHHGAKVNTRDVNAQSDDDKTALMQTQNEACLHLLLAHGADINARNAEGRTALIMATDQTWGEGDAAACDAPWVRVLLRHDAKVNLQDANGNTALMLLAAQGEYGYYNSGNPDSLADMLLAHGAGLNIRNKNGHTVWQIARHSGAKSLLRQLRHASHSQPHRK